MDSFLVPARANRKRKWRKYKEESIAERKREREKERQPVLLRQRTEEESPQRCVGCEFVASLARKGLEGGCGLNK